MRKLDAKGAARSGSSSAPGGKAGLSGGQRLWRLKWSHARQKVIYKCGGPLQTTYICPHHAAAGTVNNEPLGGGKAPHTACPGTSGRPEETCLTCVLLQLHMHG